MDLTQPRRLSWHASTQGRTVGSNCRRIITCARSEIQRRMITGTDAAVAGRNETAYVWGRRPVRLYPIVFRRHDVTALQERRAGRVDRPADRLSMRPARRLQDA